MTNPIHCLLADDHPALVTAVSDFLVESGYTLVGPVRNGDQAVALARTETPELALVDYRMPKLAGAELIIALREAAPTTAVVVYTAEADERIAREVLAAGAAGLVLKEAPLADLARALEAVHAGRSYVDPGVASNHGAVKLELTARELDVLALVAEGLSHEQIGAELGIGAETVRTHLRKACQRLGAATRTQAVAAALRLGLIA
jgi:DNA-binding NarL/FixJ family response regulator